jgi:hypothetical protein
MSRRRIGDALELAALGLIPLLFGSALLGGFALFVIRLLAAGGQDFSG